MHKRWVAAISVGSFLAGTNTMAYIGIKVLERQYNYTRLLEKNVDWVGEYIKENQHVLSTDFYDGFVERLKFMQIAQANTYTLPGMKS